MCEHLPLGGLSIDQPYVIMVTFKGLMGVQGERRPPVIVEDRHRQRIDVIGERLQAKVRSKFQTSTFLAGFAFTLLGLEIGRLWQQYYIPFLIFVCIPLMLSAAILYIYAVMKLDALT